MKIPIPDFDASDLPVGAIIRRVYNGEEHVVTVDRAVMPYCPRPSLRAQREAITARRGWWRYIYRERRYKTLTAVAREMTGCATINGNWFFGLRARRRRLRRTRA